ncbi:unnamed protein product [Amoebophrya sp. A120]|nr:unnamed protein product [Amoebophrya sp. A120]|eukprot:GSA120T00005556001.1
MASSSSTAPRVNIDDLTAMRNEALGKLDKEGQKACRAIDERAKAKKEGLMRQNETDKKHAALQVDAKLRADELELDKRKQDQIAHLQKHATDKKEAIEARAAKVANEYAEHKADTQLGEVDIAGIAESSIAEIRRKYKASEPPDDD